jgi:hypothetical protein
LDEVARCRLVAVARWPGGGAFGGVASPRRVVAWRPPGHACPWCGARTRAALQREERLPCFASGNASASDTRHSSWALAIFWRSLPMNAVHGRRRWACVCQGGFARASGPALHVSSMAPDIGVRCFFQRGEECVNEFPRESRLKLFSYAVAALSLLFCFSFTVVLCPIFGNLIAVHCIHYTRYPTLYTETRPRQPYTSADQAQLRNETKERDRATARHLRQPGRGGARRGAAGRACGDSLSTRRPRAPRRARSGSAVIVEIRLPTSGKVEGLTT